MPEILTAPPPLGTPPPVAQPHVKSAIGTPDVCPKCHQGVRPNDYFCSNCGQNLHPVPPSTTITTQAALYVGSIVLCPMGLIWGIRYFREPDAKSKMVGLICALLSVVTLIIATVAIINVINQVNSQVSKQTENLMGF